MAATGGPSAARDALVERLFEGVLGLTDVYTVYMGDRLGLYQALADGKSSEAEIAAATRRRSSSRGTTPKVRASRSRSRSETRRTQGSAAATTW
jgi:hypothetical protein